MSLTVSIIGASGYAGGELLRLLADHPEVKIQQVTSERYSGKPVKRVHPNLRSLVGLKFSPKRKLRKADLIFSAMPHGKLMHEIDSILELAPKLIDLSGDFRLENPGDFKTWYGVDHPRPELLEKFAFGIVELNRDNIRNSNLVSAAGCNAAASIIPIFPLVKQELTDTEKNIVVDAKCGSSEGGNKYSQSSHHPERSGCVRSYKPVRHRHTAEIRQALGVKVDFSATSVEMVRGILTTSHVYLKDELRERDIWKAYRNEYGKEPFIRIVKERKGNYRYPEPKLLSGTNYCDIGFSQDGKRLVVIGAIDNLMKGAAGQAVHAMNVMNRFPETTGLEFRGLHPI